MSIYSKCIHACAGWIPINPVPAGEPLIALAGNGFMPGTPVFNCFGSAAAKQLQGNKA
ncbi:MAG: hypothetical protein WBV39_02730 [Rudaea sp.]